MMDIQFLNIFLGKYEGWGFNILEVNIGRALLGFRYWPVESAFEIDFFFTHKRIEK